eukprot:CAMPEP_0171165826 /NCGR_PEP_ID=MMETSP0790-20130122/6381_1 /TAXON_ID=2925 /ORGANISM="Alexandrium catenella, Strain OF101" /LENGTH=74 /DNA_ID=CAMNT_0011630619 /DNA_START=119 /DNA_END=343 /DNA_ORIENTATION=-
MTVFSSSGAGSPASVLMMASRRLLAPTSVRKKRSQMDLATSSWATSAATMASVQGFAAPRGSETERSATLRQAA